MGHKISVLIVDDESSSRIVLQDLLYNFSFNIEVVGSAASAEEAYSLIKEKNPDLVFLDIQMPRGDGFSLLQKFERLPFEVVFVTSYNQYAINAIKFSALDYLLKPVEVADLKLAVEKAKKRILMKNNSAPLILNLLKTMGAESEEHNVAVHVGDSVKFLKENEILYIEADGSYCRLYTLNSNYTTARNIKDFEDYFGENTKFIRVHRSIYLNASHVKGYNKGEPCIIEMQDGKTFEIPRRKKAEVLEKLKN